MITTRTKIDRLDRLKRFRFLSAARDMARQAFSDITVNERRFGALEVTFFKRSGRRGGFRALIHPARFRDSIYRRIRAEGFIPYKTESESEVCHD